MYALNRTAQLAEGGPVGTGWLSPWPDLRDYTEATPQIAEMAKALGVAGRKKAAAEPDAR